MTVRDRIAANDEKFNKAAKNEAKSREERITELRGLIDQHTTELERLEREQAEEANPNVSVVPGSDQMGAIVDNTGVDGQAPEGAPEGKQTYADTKYWTVQKLQEEIASRNPDREAAGLEPLSTSGKRAELVERLMKDDEELAED
jgi:hypothetical protein